MDMPGVSRILAIGVLLTSSAFASAATVNGALGLFGISTEYSVPEVGVDFGLGLTTVLVAEDDLAPLEFLDITISNFTLAGAVGTTLLSGDDFSFVINSIQQNDVGNPAYWDFTGTGTLFLNGFDATLATWHYSDTNSATYTLSVLTTALPPPPPPEVPLPAAGPLAAMAFMSLLGLKRRRKS